MSQIEVFDTNVLIRAMVQKHGRSGPDLRALESVWNRGATLGFSRPSMDELGICLQDMNRKFGSLKMYDRLSFLSEVQTKAHSTKVVPAVAFTGCEDIEDNKIVAVALTLGCPVVTNDKELLDLNGSTVSAGNLSSPLYVYTPEQYLSLPKPPLMIAFNNLAAHGQAVPAQIAKRPKAAPPVATALGGGR